HLLTVRYIDHHCPSSLLDLPGTINLEARLLNDPNQTRCLLYGFCANLFDTDIIDNVIAGGCGIHRWHTWSTVEEPVDVVSVLVWPSLKCERILVSQPSSQPRLKLRPEISLNIKISSARPSTKPFHRATCRKIQTYLTNVQRDSTGGLINVR